jgi:uncharacterized protein
MPEAVFSAVFLAGLLGGGHCIAMCGGVVGALSGTGRAGFTFQIAHNLGRIGSYSLAGAIAGSVGGLVMAQRILPLQVALYIGTNLMLLALGAYLLGWSALVSRLEAPGRWIWRCFSPLLRRVLPADTVPRAFAAGTVWGWLPCGLTYTVLTLALLADSAATGAGLMATFGMGTLPNLLLAGAMVDRARRWMRNQWPRRIAGVVIVAAGAGGLANASVVADHLRRGVVCIL